MSETEYSSSESSLSSLGSEESVIGKEAPVSSNTKLKYIVLILSVALFISIVAIIIILIFLFFSSASAPTEDLSQEHEHEEKYEYRFYLNNDTSMFEGKVSLPEPLDGSITIFNDYGEQVMLVMGDRNMKAYKIVMDVYCCRPGTYYDDVESVGPVKEPQGCTLASIRQQFTFPAFNKDDLIDRVFRVANGERIEGMTFPSVCPLGFSVWLRFMRIKSLGKAFFVCFGNCKPSKFDYFVAGNPSLQNVDRSVSSNLFDQLSSECYTYSTSIKMNQGDKTQSDIQMEFVGMLGNFCAGMSQSSLEKELEETAGVFSRYCIMADYQCMFDPADYSF